MQYFCLVLLLQFFAKVESSGNFLYLNNDELDENSFCPYTENLVGQCKTLADCKDEYENYKNKNTDLKICKYSDTLNKDLVCCPIKPEPQKIIQAEDFTNYEMCMNAFIETRKGFRNPVDLYKALDANKKKIITDLDCDNFEKYKGNIDKAMEYYEESSKKTYKEVLKDQHFGDCINRTYFRSIYAGFASAYGGKRVMKGERTNMAAIGWSQKNNEILFNCGGSILSPRWIVTAAHCKFFGGKVADVIRVGDRFLKTLQDDEHAQQLKIEKFIIHSDYKSDLKYNDIAMVKTDENIIFMEYVNHACIPDISRNLYWNPGLSVAGFGETEDGTNGNVLLEIQAKAFGYDIEIPSYEQPECSQIFQGFQDLPNVIKESQLCVKSPRDAHGNIPDTCFGDSGSPLQLNEVWDVKDTDYDTTLMKTTYKIPLIVGLVSFGVAVCGTENPSIYTHVPFYKEWIKSVITSE